MDKPSIEHDKAQRINQAAALWYSHLLIYEGWVAVQYKTISTIVPGIWYKLSVYKTSSY